MSLIEIKAKEIRVESEVDNKTEAAVSMPGIVFISTL